MRTGCICACLLIYFLSVCVLPYPTFRSVSGRGLLFDSNVLQAFFCLPSLSPYTNAKVTAMVVHDRGISNEMLPHRKQGVCLPLWFGAPLQFHLRQFISLSLSVLFFFFHQPTPHSFSPYTPFLHTHTLSLYSLYSSLHSLPSHNSVTTLSPTNEPNSLVSSPTTKRSNNTYITKDEAPSPPVIAARHPLRPGCLCRGSPDHPAVLGPGHRPPWQG